MRRTREQLREAARPINVLRPHDVSFVSFGALAIATSGGRLVAVGVFDVVEWAQPAGAR